MSRPKKLPSSNTRLLYVFIFCIALSSLGSFIYISNSTIEASASPTIVTTDFDKILIPVPSRVVARGERLEQVEFREIPWPRDTISKDFIQKVSETKNATALTTLPANLPIPASAVTFSGIDSNAVVERIPPGFRAITVVVDAEAAVEGWARSGNFVDVIVLRQSKQLERGIEAKVIAENVKILSAGQSTEPLSGQPNAPRPPATITLLVNQEDALKIKTATSVGKLTFSLRGAGDESPTVSKTMDQKTLLDGAKTVSKPEETFKGMAKGPDGKIYMLSENAKWIRKLEDDALVTTNSRE